MCQQERIHWFSVFRSEDIAEADFKSDANESHAGPDVLVAFQVALAADTLQI
jgi:hypothetical protein